MAELPPPPEGIALAHFIVSNDVERSRRFYTELPRPVTCSRPCPPVDHRRPAGLSVCSGEGPG